MYFPANTTIAEKEFLKLLESFRSFKQGGTIQDLSAKDRFLDLLDKFSGHRKQIDTGIDINKRRFLTLLDTLKTHQKPRKMTRLKLSPLLIGNFLESITGLRAIELEELEKELVELTSQFKVKISTFELMQHNFRENTHSNILQYLLNPKIHGERAVGFLKMLLKDNKQIEESFINTIENTGYEIIREFSTDKGRIDLLIINYNAKFLVLIENKILSNIGKGKFERGSENGIELKQENQLESYFSYFEEKYPDYKKAYLLISFKNQNENHPEFIEINYEEIRHSLQKSFAEYHDNVYEEYLLLLKRLKSNIDLNYHINQLNERNHFINEKRNLLTFQKLKNLIADEYEKKE